jgi:hypothetical protein
MHLQVCGEEKGRNTRALAHLTSPSRAEWGGAGRGVARRGKAMSAGARCARE